MTTEDIDAMTLSCVQYLETHWSASLYSDYAASMRCWVSRGATLEDVADSIAVTKTRGRGNYWRYFCGVMWKKLKRRTVAVDDESTVARRVP